MTGPVRSVSHAGAFAASDGSPRRAKDFVKCTDARCPHLTDRRFSGGAAPHCHPVFDATPEPAIDWRAALFNF